MNTYVLAAESTVEVGVHPKWHFLGLTFNADTLITWNNTLNLGGPDVFVAKLLSAQ